MRSDRREVLGLSEAQNISGQYIPILIYLVVALIVPLVMSGAVTLISRARQRPEPFKYSPYESGFPTTPLTGRFPVKFYLVAMLFVIFDVEAASFYPWAVNLRDLGAFGLFEMVAFLVVLAIGYAFVWKKGGFQWR